MEAIACLGLLKLFSKLTAGECYSYSCLLGKTAVVTGGSGGIGYETGVALAARGCKVIVADVENGTSTVKRMVRESENEKIIYKHVDLASFDSIRSFAEDMNTTEDRLDILIHSAGTGGYRETYTKDGLLKTMQINHFGPFLLTYLLTKLLKKTEDSRIVFVSSIFAYFHYINSVKDMTEPPKQRRDIIHNMVEYNNSKLCTMIASFGFARKLQTSGVMCNCVYPGLVETKIFEASLDNMRSNSLDVTLTRTFLPYLLYLYAKTPTEGAQTSLHCALSSKLNVTGTFFVDCREFVPPPKAQIDSFRWELWQETEKIVGIRPEEKL